MSRTSVVVSMYCAAALVVLALGPDAASRSFSGFLIALAIAVNFLGGIGERDRL